jgi:cell shape-determining protein MreD
MVLLTVTGFFVFLFTDVMSDRVFGIKRYILAFLFITYAVYRSYRMFRTLKPKMDKDI